MNHIVENNVAGVRSDGIKNLIYGFCFWELQEF